MTSKQFSDSITVLPKDLLNELSTNMDTEHSWELLIDELKVPFATKTNISNHTNPSKSLFDYLLANRQELSLDRLIYNLRRVNCKVEVYLIQKYIHTHNEQLREQKRK